MKPCLGDNLWEALRASHNFRLDFSAPYIATEKPGLKIRKQMLAKDYVRRSLGAAHPGLDFFKRGLGVLGSQVQWPSRARTLKAFTLIGSEIANIVARKEL